MLGNHCFPKARRRKSSSGRHCNGLYIQQNPKWEVSGANPWPHWCVFFGNGLGVRAHGHHFLMDLIDGKANTGSLRVQSLATLMRTFWQKASGGGGLIPRPILYRSDLECNETQIGKSQGGKVPGRSWHGLDGNSLGGFGPPAIVGDGLWWQTGSLRKYYSGHARTWALPMAWTAKKV